MQDCHFDELAAHFAHKIYGGSKGAVRLAALQADLTEVLATTPLRILDVGGGLGHMSLWLAELGHRITFTEPALPMLKGAKQHFTQKGLTAEFVQASWQELPNILTEQYDLVLCHAVLEWLAQPAEIMPVLKQFTKTDGWLSLAFYNKDSLVFRNLIKGNLRKLAKLNFAGEQGSLTPQQPLDPRQVEAFVEPLWKIQHRSGIRVFHDYMLPKFQEKIALEEMIATELSYRRHPSLSLLGRYLHWLCQPR